LEEENWSIIEENILLKTEKNLQKLIESGKDADGYIQRIIELG